MYQITKFHIFSEFPGVLTSPELFFHFPLDFNFKTHLKKLQRVEDGEGTVDRSGQNEMIEQEGDWR